ncbi:hypothetical protein Cgig2_000526 [Carnegiea gigantea]|uniref:hAT-like transposase RNase-H fold domain-containing protein n=1 Tax=Carnegiea gigantea TaxID=171969 RepID=A0A9Q1JGW3_9CARY|nr:hypothetical protein Cgig2_000526 [Carnegiea gigantea]
MTSNYEDLVPIDVDSNGEDVAEVNSKEANRPTTIRTWAYKPQATAGGVGKPPKCQRNLTSSKYWSEFSIIMAIATILDLHYKYQFTELAYKKVYDDSYDIGLRLLKEKLFALYGEYAKSFKGSFISSNPTSSNAQATSNVESQSDSFMEELYGDVMKMNLHDNEDGEDQSKSAAGSGFGQNSALVN